MPMAHEGPMTSYRIKGVNKPNITYGKLQSTPFMKGLTYRKPHPIETAHVEETPPPEKIEEETPPPEKMEEETPPPENKDTKPSGKKKERKRKNKDLNPTVSKKKKTNENFDFETILYKLNFMNN